MAVFYFVFFLLSYGAFGILLEIFPEENIYDYIAEAYIVMGYPMMWGIIGIVGLPSEERSGYPRYLIATIPPFSLIAIGLFVVEVRHLIAFSSNPLVTSFGILAFSGMIGWYMTLFLIFLADTRRQESSKQTQDYVDYESEYRN